jgi:hypothetical protein
MVTLKRLAPACLAVLVGVSLHAQDIATLKIGDKAPQDIVATVPFDVVDAQATAALKISKAHTIAAIYHEFAGETNVITKNFLNAFARAHTDFTTAVNAEYNQASINNTEIESSDFGYFLTAYNVEHKKFPVTTELAVSWAHGDSGAALRDKWLAQLMQAMDQPVQPDPITPHFIYANKIRIMAVKNPNQKFTFDAAWKHGHVVPADSVPTLSSLRTKFRKQFSPGEQPLGGALAQFLLPNCFPDLSLTKDARDFSVRQIVAADHFDAGQVMVRSGDVIDAQARAALDQLSKELVPTTLNKQIAAEQQQAQQASQLARQEADRAKTEHDAAQLAQQQQQQAQLDRDHAMLRAQQASEQAATLRAQAQDAQNLALKIRRRDEWLFAGLAAGFLLVLAVLWRLFTRQAPVSVSVPAKLERMEQPATLPPELAPYLAQTLKEAVVQGLAAQRAELLEVQRQAAMEIAELVQRLDHLQAPMQERLRAYQDRIQELQKDLAERTEENRELLKLKIEMMRRHLESERTRVKFN